MLRDRVLAAIPLLAVAVAAFSLPGWAGGVVFMILTAFFAVAASLEFFTLSSAAGLRGYRLLTTCFGCLYLVVSAWDPAPASPTGILVLASFCGACFVTCLRSGAPSAATLGRVWVSFGGFVYLFWCLSFLVKLFFMGPDTQGRLLLLYLVAVTKTADVGAYVVGTLTSRRPQGNHKLIPSISPKKSWEGLLGGVLFSVVVSLVLVWTFDDRILVSGKPVLGVLSGVLFGIIAPVLGLLGDVAESSLKRAAKMSDSGRLPGLGGALDILDSLIPVSPLFFAYIVILVHA